VSNGIGTYPDDESDCIDVCDGAFSDGQHVGCLLRETTLMTVFKQFEGAQKRWRRLNGARCLGDVLEGGEF
jgi:hypothetical protein